MRRRDINEELPLIGGLNHGACVAASLRTFNDSDRRRIRWVRQRRREHMLGRQEVWG